jgi:DNA helicase HerA-like ATPase
VQHALRAFTPRDQKAVRAAADTFRQNPKLKTAEVITELGVGEALVSLLEGKGTPSIVERALIAPPAARVGPLTAAERRQAMNASPMRGKYDTPVDAESAYEMLMKRRQMAQAQAEQADAGAAPGAGGGFGGMLDSIFGGGAAQGGARPRGRQPQSMAEKAMTSAARSAATSVGRQLGNALVRGVLGSLLGGGGRRR